MEVATCCLPAWKSHHGSVGTEPFDTYFSYWWGPSAPNPLLSSYLALTICTTAKKISRCCHNHETGPTAAEPGNILGHCCMQLAFTGASTASGAGRREGPYRGCSRLPQCRRRAHLARGYFAPASTSPSGARRMSAASLPASAPAKRCGDHGPTSSTPSSLPVSILCVLVIPGCAPILYAPIHVVAADCPWTHLFGRYRVQGFRRIDFRV